MKVGLPNLEPNGTEADQRLTVDATAGGVQFAAFHTKTSHILLTLEDAEIRYTLDDSAPTTTNGHVLASGQERVWPVELAAAAKFICTGAVSGVIHASQLRVR